MLQVLSPNYVLADRASQERRVTAWGALLAQCGQEGSRIAGLQWLERTLPDSGQGLAEWWANAGRPDSRFAADLRGSDQRTPDRPPPVTRPTWP